MGIVEIALWLKEDDSYNTLLQSSPMEFQNEDILILFKTCCRTISKAIDIDTVCFLNSISRPPTSEREKVKTTIKAAQARLTISIWIMSPISINIKELFRYSSLIIVESMAQSQKERRLLINQSNKFAHFIRNSYRISNRERLNTSKICSNSFFVDPHFNWLDAWALRDFREFLVYNKVSSAPFHNYLDFLSGSPI